MNEIILDLAALALALFCLIDSVRERRDPLPKGPGAVLRDRRAVYIAALGALVISAARGLGLRLGAPAGLLRVLGVLSGVFQLVLALAFVLYLAALFRPDRYGGSGLGMAITRSIVEMMDGEIGVESEKGFGTTFTVSVRLGRVLDAQAAEVPAEEAPAEDISLEGRHILIAEDQAMNAEILTDLLELEDMSSEWAENGRLALELFAGSEERHFDAILMDMHMPVLDGLGATEAIRKLDRPDARTIPIIALTANAFEEDVKQCLQAGMDAHLSKPVDIEKLKDTLRRLLAAKS